MNILIYIPEISQAQGGVRQYSVGLLRILSKDDDNKYFVYHNANDPEILDIISKNEHLKIVKDIEYNVFHKKIVRVKNAANFFARKINRNSLFDVTSQIDGLIDKYCIDVVHCPYQFIPVTKKAKLIVTLHDVQELHFPEFFTAEERACRAVDFLDYLRRADGVVVSYSHIKEDIVKYFSVPSSNIHVILLDMGRLWFENFIGKDVASLGQFNLPEQFILYPANTWKHKNHSRLLKSVAILRDKYGCLVNLVCSGHQNSHYINVISEEIKELNLESQVKFLGVVEEQILFSLYKGCLGVVVPTLYEAGSFPLMESILLGVPVICSNVTSLPETIGNDNFVFDPFDVESIAQRIHQLWTSSDFRIKSIENSSKASLSLRNTGALNKFNNLYKYVY